MLWPLLLLNIATTIIAFQKRMIFYGAQMFFFLFLVVGQAFAIQGDLQGVTSISYRYADMTVEGFHLGVFYVYGVTLLSFVLVFFSKGYVPGSRVAIGYTFRPPPVFYKLFFAGLVALACVLVFAVVGLSEFLASSRPGFQSGSTIFIVLLFVGCIPLLLKIMTQTPIATGDIACFMVSLLVTTGFSRIHDVLYALIISSVYFYSTWADRYIAPKKALAAVLLSLLLGSGFFVIGAIRDAENFTGGSFSAIASYILSKPENSLLSLTRNYRVGVEGMSGLVGAFTTATVSPHRAHFDGGTYWLLKGLTQWWPGSMKAYFSDLITDINTFQWYTPSNVASGVEESYTSYSWFGMFFFPVSVWLMEWVWPKYLLLRPWSIRTKLICYVMIGCGIFFVRGSYSIWVGYLVSYWFVLYFSWPIFRPWLKARAAEGPLPS